MYIAVAVLWLMMVLFVCLFYWCCGLRIDLFSFVRLCFSCCGYLINRLFGFAIVVVLQSKSIYSISVRKFVQFVVRSILCCQSMDMSCFGKMIIEHDPSHWLYTFTHNIINNMFSVFFFFTHRLKESEYHVFVQSKLKRLLYCTKSIGNE